MSAKTCELKHIAVSQTNYFWLKNLGRAGDSFNDVITKLRENKEESQAGQVDRQSQHVTAATAPKGGSG